MSILTVLRGFVQRKQTLICYCPRPSTPRLDHGLVKAVLQRYGTHLKRHLVVVVGHISAVRTRGISVRHHSRWSGVPFIALPALVLGVFHQITETTVLW